MLCTELDLVLKTARDLFTDDIESIVIDDKEQYLRLVRFVEMFMPARVKGISVLQRMMSRSSTRTASKTKLPAL